MKQTAFNMLISDHMQILTEPGEVFIPSSLYAKLNVI